MRINNAPGSHSVPGTKFLNGTRYLLCYNTFMAQAYVTPQELQQLTKLRTWRSVFGVASDWLIIAAAFILIIAYPNPFTYIFSFILISRQQLALALLMHDGSHRRLAASAKLSDFIAQWFCAAPLFFSMFSYQKLHLKHHRDPLAKDDPDFSLIGGYPISKMSLSRKLFRDAIGLSYIKFIRYFIYMARKPKSLQPNMITTEKPNERKIGHQGSMSLASVATSILITNFALFAALYFLDHPWLYLTHWFLPMATSLQVLLRIRGIAEHAGYEANPDQRLNSRTVVNPFQTFIFAPHYAHYHLEHHIYPAVPYYNLPKLHKLMKERGHIPEAQIYSGYGQVLKELTRKQNL